MFPYRKHAKFCSRECKTVYGQDKIVCKHCGNQFIAQKHKKRQYCSDTCARNKIINSSKGEKELFVYITQHLGYSAIPNKAIATKLGIFKPDITIQNKIIEFYGDYWHCSSDMFGEFQYNKSIGMFAWEKRKIDDLRINALQDANYNVLIIWEKDWNTLPHVVQNNIKQFLEA